MGLFTKCFDVLPSQEINKCDSLRGNIYWQTTAAVTPSFSADSLSIIYDDLNARGTVNNNSFTALHLLHHTDKTLINLINSVH